MQILNWVQNLDMAKKSNNVTETASDPIPVVAEWLSTSKILEDYVASIKLELKGDQLLFPTYWKETKVEIVKGWDKVWMFLFENKDIPLTLEGAYKAISSCRYFNLAYVKDPGFREWCKEKENLPAFEFYPGEGSSVWLGVLFKHYDGFFEKYKFAIQPHEEAEEQAKKDAEAQALEAGKLPRQGVFNDPLTNKGSKPRKKKQEYLEEEDD